MIISEQPGRLIAVLIFAPLLIYKGYNYEDYYLIIFGILLFIWDLFWIITYPAKKVEIP